LSVWEKRQIRANDEFICEFVLAPNIEFCLCKDKKSGLCFCRAAAKIEVGFFVALEISGSPSFSLKNADFRESFQKTKDSQRKVVRAPDGESPKGRITANLK